MADPHADQPTSGQTPEQTTRSWTGWKPGVLPAALVLLVLGGMIPGGTVLQEPLSAYLGVDVSLLPSIGLAAGALALVAGVFKLVIIVWQAFWSPVWKRLRGSLERWGGLFLTGMTGRYRRYMLRTAEFVDPTGLDTGAGKADFALADVYVDVALDRSSPTEVSNDLLGGMEGDRQPLARFLDADDRRPLVIIGAPGSGKTTLLRHTVRRVCEERGPRARIPVLLYLNEHAGTITDRPEVALVELIRKAVGPDHLREPPGWFEQQLRQGRCVVMLDGLDEVGSDQGRRAVAAWAQTQTEIHHRNTFVLTSRPHGYRNNRIKGAEVLRVKPFTRGQISTFTHGWFRAHEKLGEESRGTAEELLARIWGRNALRELAVNPMLLSMIVSVHLYHGQLPDTRADLYREMFRVVLWKRQQNVKGVEPKTSGAEQEKLLSGLAHQMMSDRVRSLPREKVEELLGGEALGDFIRCGAMVDRGNGESAFAHHTFQEYLAADHMRREGLPEDLHPMVLDSWWRETLLLYSAIADAGPVVRTALEVVVGTGSRAQHIGTLGDDLPALLLAHECAEQARNLDEELRTELGKLLAQGLDPKAPETLVRLTTQVHASRDLRELVPLESGAFLCARPVSVDLYRHFLRDSRIFGEYRNPDGPDFRDEGPLNDSGPVRGVWGTDARAFAAWINYYTPKEERWRLPTPDELRSAEYQAFLREPYVVHAQEAGIRELVASEENSGEAAKEASGEKSDTAAGREGRQLAEELMPYLTQELDRGRVDAGLTFRLNLHPRTTSYDIADLVERSELILGRVCGENAVSGEEEEEWVGLAKEAEALLRSVREVFGRRKALTDGTKTQMRSFAALISLDDRGSDQELTDLCWDIAVVVTRLRLQQEGELPSDGTIILARD